MVHAAPGYGDAVFLSTFWVILRLSLGEVGVKADDSGRLN
jgi:hypothetical protein